MTNKTAWLADGRSRGGEGLGDNLAGGRPVERLDLSGSVQNEGPVSLGLLLGDLVMQLVDIASEQIEAGHDRSIGPELVLVHDLLVIMEGSNIEVTRIRSEGDRRVSVDNKGKCLAIADQVVLECLVNSLRRKWTCRCRPFRWLGRRSRVAGTDFEWWAPGSCL